MKKYIFSLRFLLLLCILGAIVFTYWDLPKTFYQQDEWLGSGRVVALGFQTITYGLSPLQILFADSRPLTGILGVIIFKIFPFQSLPLALYGIGFHILNTLLVFLIAKKLLKKDIPSIISAALFGLSSISQQSITWFAASFGVQPASFCIFLSIYLFILYIEKGKSKFAYSSLFLALLSLYFKESGIFLFIFLPLLPFLFEKKVNRRGYFKIFVPLIIFILLFVIYRLFEMTVAQFGSSSLIKAPVYANVGQGKLFFIETIVSRAIMYPLTSLSLVYIPVYKALSIAQQFMIVYYPYITERIDLISETVVLDLISSSLSLIILFLCLLEMRRNIFSKQVLSFSLLFFLLSILPYVVVGKSFAYMEPRYYYIPLAATAILVGYVARRLIDLGKKFTLIKLFFLVAFIWLLTMYISETRQAVSYQVQVAQMRLSFLQQLHQELPTLTSKTNVFYFDGDKVWWDDNNKIPFQHGFGYSVPVLYYDSGKMPRPLLIYGYFWSLGSEGYKSFDGLSYGYYSSLDHMKKGMEKYHFSPEDIHAFYYDSHSGKLMDTSIEIRQELSNAK